MEVIRYTYGHLNEHKPVPSVVALGFFDGVHLAHRELLRMARDAARHRGERFLVFTFAESDVYKSDKKRIYPERDKLAIIEGLGADATVCCDFSSVRDLSAEEFIDNVLIRDLGLTVAVCGFNFRFGKNRSAGPDELSHILEIRGLGAKICAERRLFDSTLSSTLIRELLAGGKLEEANEALGSPYFIRGVTEHGRGVGHKLGIPTVNTDTPPERLLVPSGVYLTETEIDGRKYPSLTNVGICPTFDARPRHAETFILGFDGDLYGEDLTIRFLSYLRQERIFKSEKELVLQINVDKKAALSLYEKLRNY